MSIGTNVFNMPNIAMAFDHACHALSAAMQDWNQGALEPSSDEWLRQMAVARVKFLQPQLGHNGARKKLDLLKELPPPVLTLMLGAVPTLSSCMRACMRTSVHIIFRVFHSDARPG